MIEAFIILTLLMGLAGSDQPQVEVGGHCDCHGGCFVQLEVEASNEV